MRNRIFAWLLFRRNAYPLINIPFKLESISLRLPRNHLTNSICYPWDMRQPGFEFILVSKWIKEPTTTTKKIATNAYALLNEENLSWPRTPSVQRCQPLSEIRDYQGICFKRRVVLLVNFLAFTTSSSLPLPLDVGRKREAKSLY